MKKLASLAFSFLFIATALTAQDAPKKRQKGAPATATMWFSTSLGMSSCQCSR